MINRILIRSKVIQLLYSYIITKSEFAIEPQPDSTSREKRFAYQVYLTTINIILLLAGVRIVKNIKSLSALAAKNRLLKTLWNEDEVKVVLSKNDSDTEQFVKLANNLYDEIVNSSVYRSFVRLKEYEPKEEARFWVTVIESSIARNEEFMSFLRQNSDFSIAGFEKGISQVVKTIESFNESRFMLRNAEKELDKSFEKAYELYQALLLLPVEITRLRSLQIDSARHKLLPTASDLNPNTKFIDNQLPILLKNSVGMKEFMQNHKNYWGEEQDLIKRLLDIILQSDVYREYMESDISGREADCSLWRKLMKNVILPSDDLAEVLESKSVYWNDDLEIIGTFVLKTIKLASKEDKDRIEILPKYKDAEDEEFGASLFKLAATHYHEFREYVEKFINVSSWDPERIALMDIIILVTAITEIVYFPKIALPVSINEYVEIANSYSTNRSGQFVNGVLFSVTNYLRDEGKLIGK